MDYNQGVTVERDCEAILIPAGTHIKLRKGSVVFILQALGGNYTVNINGNLAQVAARDADALGFDTDLPDMQAREPGDGGVHGRAQRTQVKGPRGGLTSAFCQVFPPSVETSRSLIPRSPAKATPPIQVRCPTFTGPWETSIRDMVL